MKFELLRPDETMKEEYYYFIEEWEKSGEEIVPAAVRSRGMDYKSWLEHTYKFESEETCPEGLVPAHTYFLISEDKRVIGAVNIRHYLNNYLLSYGGHVGYGIRPSERKKGYAALMLSMALPLAKGLGIVKALITCDKNNIGSAKTIIKNGGILENEVEQKGEVTQRYWIEI